MVDDSDDLEAIRQLKARYFRCLDTKQWDALREVFTADVEVDMTGEGAGVSHGPDEFVGGVSRILESVTTVHHGHMPELQLTSPTTATGLWAMEDELWWPEGSPIRHLHGYGHYHETYTKTAAGWRISSMRLTRLQRLVEPAGNAGG
jgi:hypothetical protein